MISILVTGRMGAGKDVFADYLVKRHQFVKTAFADGIRDFIREYNYDYVDKSNRGLEIDVGMAMRRWFGDSIWINFALADLFRTTQMYSELDIPISGYVISDGRFPREYEMCVKERGFVHVHISSLSPERKHRLLGRDGVFNEELFDSPDDCQVPISDGTYIIDNNGTLEEFYHAIDTLIERLEASHE